MSRMYLAAAGSGKTTFLLEMTSDRSKRFLYTTFTDENSAVAEEMLVAANGRIPTNVTVLPWFSFLLEHGVRPFQGAGGFGDVRLDGVELSPEGINYNKRPAPGYYFNAQNRVYVAKLPELALYCDRCSGGAVLDRIGRLFDVILVDEAQDMAGYDFDFISGLIKLGVEVVICGDERQTTYRTNAGKKHRGQSLEQFLYKEGLAELCPIDREKLNGSYRCPEEIIQFANKLYPDFSQTSSLAPGLPNRHSGVWIVPDSLVEAYVDAYDPVVLRDKANVKTVKAHAAINFGRAKGRTYDDVLIYPVGAVREWLAGGGKGLRDQTRSRFYVAITRARASVGIVVPDKDAHCLSDRYKIWGPPD